MKTKKNKGFKKSLSFYRINFQFQQPYQLVLDGTFIKIMDDNAVDIDRQFFKYTKAKLWKHTTTCVLRELKSLSNHFPRAYQRALKLSQIDCRHIEGVSPSECLQELVQQTPEIKGKNNFYWVCTQDEELRTKLHQIDHVPVCYLYQNNLLELAEPSKISKLRVKELTSTKYMPNEIEQKCLQPIKKQIKQEEAAKRMKKERKLVQELVIKIKKPAKGPNPLSMKRKTIRKVKQEKRRHKIKCKGTRRALKQYCEQQ